MKKQTMIAAAVLAVTAAMPAHALVMLDFNYTDVNFGFTDPTLISGGSTLGAARQGALESAADYVSSFLTSYNATIVMDVDSNTTTAGTLAAAGSNYNAPGVAGFVEQGDVMRKILGGDSADPDPLAADGNVTWNFTTENWELGTDFQPGEYDFFSTAVHELLHALGFVSEISQFGEDAYGSTASGDPGIWGPFDEFLASSNTGHPPLIDPTSYIIDSTLWSAASLSQDGNGTVGCGAGILFTGPNAMAANGGNAVEIYSPSTWEDGSSGSHLDDNCYTAPGNVSTYMMEAQTIDGLGVRTISPLEVGIFRDIGYTNFGVAQSSGTVPEPSTLYLTLSALGLLGLKLRKKAA